MRYIRQIAWQAINVYAEYCDKGYSKEAAREKAEQEVLECYAGVSVEPAPAKDKGLKAARFATKETTQ
jgi:hypothetical protein